MRIRKPSAPTVFFCLLLAAPVSATWMSPLKEGDAVPYDPLHRALVERLEVANFEASVPAQCYTKTGPESNACWVCHTSGRGENHLVDYDLQAEYAFSDVALTNAWENLFVDRTEAIAAISDEEVLGHVRADNYTPLRRALEGHPEHRGWGPDLDFDAGFDDLGFARDGSGWRALRYQPFPGTFWPTNGSTDDVFLRLPEEFRSRDGQPSLETYRLNLALLEASIASPDRLSMERVVEPVDEGLCGFDLDGDGTIGGTITTIRHLPPHFAGDAKSHELLRWLHPQGVEYLHTVRYLDPDAPGMMARRMKEVRYSKKVQLMDLWGVVYRYEREFKEKEEGNIPMWRGGPDVGLQNDFGWLLKGYIEDEVGRLRLQTTEEQMACMGCHSAVGVTVDQTFTLARKLPGSAGWAHQNLAGLRDRPQHGHGQPEVLTYLERARGGDEFRANTEMIERWFDADGRLRTEEVLRAAPGGDRDLLWLVGPSRERALALNKAYLALVREQRFELGRDTLLGPIENVHRSLTNDTSDLGAADNIYTDGVLWMDWNWSRADD